MGLFGDTLRDARRPLAGAWVRRSADASPELDSAPDEMPDTGMQTVFRFQKGAAPGEIPAAAREASPGPAAGRPVAPAADPLPVGAEVGTPEPLATNVIGYEGISDFLEVSRTSELETGQVIHGSPGKMAAANANAESSASRSEVLSGRLESEPYREPHKSNIPEGSERSVSESGETSRSRPAGRGASPSETSSIRTTLSRATAHPPLEGEGLSRKPAAEGVPSPYASANGRHAILPTASPASERSPIHLPSPLEGPAHRAQDATELRSRAQRGMGHSPTEGPGERGTKKRPPQTIPFATAMPETAWDAPQSTTSPARSVAAGWNQAIPHLAGTRPPERTPDPAPPSLVIGRIDVMVVADAPARPQPAARPDTGYLSRHYLKRL